MKTKFCLAIISLILSLPSWANWQLDTRASQINFISIKKEKIAEVHHFDQFSGAINQYGDFQLVIDLASVNTGIDIRNQRMQTLLFNVAKFAKASVNVNVAKLLANSQVGQVNSKQVTAMVDLHGFSVPVNFSINVVKLSKNKLVVYSSKPALINAEQFGLTTGIDKLKAVAKLPSIAYSVPLTFSLTFSR